MIISGNGADRSNKYSMLALVEQELLVETRATRDVLDQLLEGGATSEVLEQFLSHLYRTQGVLKMVEIHGAALLAEELEKTARKLLSQSNEAPTPDQLEVLLRAVDQFSTYVERIVAGGRDVPLILLPLFNDLRAVRGEPLVSEGSLFNLAQRRSTPLAAEFTPVAGLNELIRRVRPRFQLSLLNLIRGTDPEKNIKVLLETAEQLGKELRAPHLKELWVALAALLEGLLLDELTDSLAVKRLLGQADRELRRLAEQGEAVCNQMPPVDLLNNVLYYLAQAQTGSSKVQALQQEYRLAEIMSALREAQEAEGTLTAPSVQLMTTVADAVREDLSKIKDALDLMARKPAVSKEELLGQIDTLKRIGDTVGVLGLGDLREQLHSAVRAQYEEHRGPTVDPAQLLHLATLIVGVEGQLQPRLLNAVVSRSKDNEFTTLFEEEFKQAQLAVSRECLSTLMRARELLPSEAAPARTDFSAGQKLLQTIAVSLWFCNFNRASEATARLRDSLAPREVQASDRFNLLAEALVSLECYLELLQKGKGEPEHLLEHFESALNALEGSAGTEVSVGDEPGEAAEQAEPSEVEALPDLIRSIIQPAAPAEELPVLNEVVEAAEGLPEIEEVFEEALPAPTLPAIEILSESVVEELTPAPSAGQGLSFEPVSGEYAELLDQLSLPVATGPIEAKPVEITYDTPREPIRLTPAPAPVVSAPSAAGASGVVNSARPPIETTADSEIVELFLEEAQEILDRIHPLLARWSQAPDDEKALRELRREFHTLKGSGRIAKVRRVGDVAEQAEHLLNDILRKVISFGDDSLRVIQEAADGLPSLLDETRTGVESFDLSRLLERIKQVRNGEALIEAAEIMEAAAAQAVPPKPAVDAEAELNDLLGYLPTSAEMTSEIEIPGFVDPGIPEEIEEDVGFAEAEPLAEAGPATESPTAGSDPVLREIFHREAHVHVSAIRAFLARCHREMAPHTLTSEVYRACHTLSGIAKTAGVRQGIKMAGPMEGYIRKLHENNLPLSAEGANLLEDTLNGIEKAVNHINENTGFFPNQAQLIDRWHALDAQLETLLSSVSPSGRLEQETSAALNGKNHELFEDFISGEQISAGHGPAVLDFELPAEPEPTTLPAEEIESSVTASEAGLSLDEVAGELPPVDLSLPADEASDLLEIFLEEASDLLEQAEAIVQEWGFSGYSSERALELKRVLHTLKGGARMAGLQTMGSLSHELETFLLKLSEKGSVPSSARDVVVQTLDGLQQLREAAGSDRAVNVSALFDGLQTFEAEKTGVNDGIFDDSSTARVEMPVVEFEPTPVPEADIELLPVVEVGSGEISGPLEFAAEAEPVAPEPSDLAEHTDEPAETSCTPEAASAVEVSAPQRPATVEDYIQAVDSASSGLLVGLPPSNTVPTDLATSIERGELARVDIGLLDALLNNAGEVSIYRARVEQQVTSSEFNLAELGRTVTRLREQLRKLELETEAQILFKHQDDSRQRAEFDPLELDRYSTIQQLSRALAESANDVASIEAMLGGLNREAQNLLQQQGRVIAELQNDLMRTRMVPFQRHGRRLSRLVRQAAQEQRKQVELQIEGGTEELDRQILERMLSPFEHMLRNAVVHGIEPPDLRIAAGKPAQGRLSIRLQRESSEVIIIVEDDGGGINTDAVRNKAIQLKLIKPEQVLSEDEALQLILEPGFSTATHLSETAGRGVGMDVVATEVRKLGGSLNIQSVPGEGTRFIIRLPFTLAVTQALIVRVHDNVYALPVTTVEGVARLTPVEIERRLKEAEPSFEYGGWKYRFESLGAFLGNAPTPLPETEATLPVVLVRAGDQSVALVADELLGSRELVVKSVGPQLSSVPGVAGAAILGDGRIVIIMDAGAVARAVAAQRKARHEKPAPQEPLHDERILALVVDDSITVRRVTQRILERNGMRVITAKDGIEALELMQDQVPDIILLDIEMPRMDGYEVATHVRHDPRLAEIPIVMITSRTGEKHRSRAIELGVDDYLGKPYQEADLLAAIEPLVKNYRENRSAHLPTEIPDDQLPLE